MVKNILKPLAKIVEWMIFIALVLIFLIVISPVLPFDNVPRTYSVVTGSMEPTIKTGSLVLTKPITEVRQDQIIAFTSPDNGKDVILHRVFDNSDLSAIKTKGDNNSAEDHWAVKKDDILGEYVTGVPYAGNISMYMRRPVGFAVMIGLPALAIILVQIFNIKTGIEQEVEKRLSKRQDPTKVAMQHLDGRESKKKITTDKLVALVMIALGLSMLMAKQVIYAWYIDTATISGITLSVKDFVAPAVPQITAPDDGTKDQPDDVTVEWTTVEDYLNMNPVYYQFRLVNAFNLFDVVSFSNTTDNWQNLAGVADGTYKAYVRACDELENCSEWSDSRTYIVDNTAPAVPTLVSPMDQTGNSSQLVQKWTKQYDNHGGEVSYYYESYGDKELTDLRWTAWFYNSVNTDPSNPLYIIKNAQGAPNGEVYWRVRAIDEVGNQSEFSLVGHFTVDNGMSSSITVTGSPAKDVEDRVENGNFEQGLGSWSSIGRVSSVQDDLTASQVVKLGDVESGNNFAQVSQIVDNSQLGLRTLGFWYRPMIFETDLGFDQPIFEVKINGQSVYQLNDLTQLNQWQFVAIDLSEFNTSTINLQFSLANIGDDLASNIIYLDNISTNFAVVNNDAIFTVKAEKGFQPVASYRYFVNGVEFAGSQENNISFSLSDQPDDQVVEYWLSDNQGNEEEHHLINVIYDSQSSSKVDDLLAIAEVDGEYALSFTAPSDNLFTQVEKYEIKYSLAEITSENWADLPNVTINADPNFSSLTATKTSGQTERFIVMGLEDGKQYNFAVRSIDTAHNVSDISNIATVNLVTEKSVVINEIMYNPVGDDFGQMPNGEWIEFYSLSNDTIDMNGWYLKDEAGNIITVSQANSDNNLNTADSGETKIFVNSYLVTYRNSSAIFNNTGDTLYLFDQNGGLIDTVSYQGGKDEGLTDARIPDGTGDLVDPIPTPGRTNVVRVEQLTPQVILQMVGGSKVGFSLIDTNHYQSADYSIFYTRLSETGEKILDALQGHLDLDGSAQINKDDIYLGTCSGEACTDHLGITDVSIEVKLTNKDGEELVIFSK